MEQETTIIDPQMFIISFFFKYMNVWLVTYYHFKLIFKWVYLKNSSNSVYATDPV